MTVTSSPPPGRFAVLAPALRLVLYGAVLVVLGDLLVHRVPADSAWAVFGEDGRLEIAQDVLLLLGIALAVGLAVRVEAWRAFGILVAGLLAAGLVREQNNFFLDRVGPGTWQLVVLAVLAATAALLWPRRRSLLPALGRFLGTPAFAWVGAGLLALAFAQLLDEQALWELVLERPDPPYVARRVVEESLEFLGYALGTIGLVELVLASRREPPAGGDPTG